MDHSLYVGVDIGSQNTVIVKDDGDIVRTDTGSISLPTLIAFDGRERVSGEQAQAHSAGESTVTMVNDLMGKTMEEICSTTAATVFKHRRVPITQDVGGRLLAEVNYNGGPRKFFTTALMGLFLHQLHKHVTSVNGNDTSLAFALYPNYPPVTKRAYQDACVIAGIPPEKVVMVDMADAMIATYAWKIGHLDPEERQYLEGRHVLLVDMGHTQTTVVLVKVSNVSQRGEDILVEKVGVGYDDALGAHHFDAQLFDFLSSSKCPNANVKPATKKGHRLMYGCEKLRKLLSQLHEADITVERLEEDSDIKFSLQRDDLAKICAELLERFRTLLVDTLKPAPAGNGVEEEGQDGMVASAPAADPVSVAAVELLGGGCRMQIVQDVISSVLSSSGGDVVVGHKLDDSTVALGAALISKRGGGERAGADGGGVAGDGATTVPESGFLTQQELETARAEELAMQAQDVQLRLVGEERNKIESYILEMRHIPSKPQGKDVDSRALNSLLDESENWLWDTGEDVMAIAVTEYEERYRQLQEQVTALCASYFAAVEAERLSTEKGLEEEAQRAAAEREANGEDANAEDHDTRKLKKADRLRLVMKNKEEGTELFKDKNFRPAAARYTKALTHCTKFFDLSPEDEREIAAVKLSLYLNLANCYLKLDNWEAVLRNANEALLLDGNHVKALFRRASYHEKKKDWASANKDLKQAGAHAATGSAEEAAIATALERVKKEVQKEKAQDKKTWGKMFG